MKPSKATPPVDKTFAAAPGFLITNGDPADTIANVHDVLAAIGSLLAQAPDTLKALATTPAAQSGVFVLVSVLADALAAAKATLEAPRAQP